MRLIRRYARAIAEEFKPDKIILFGSHAYGTPTEDSDVDLLVVMSARDRHSLAVRILMRLAAPFPIDLIIRTPEQIKRRLEDKESFTTTIMTEGKVLYEKEHAAVGPKGRGGLHRRRTGKRVHAVGS
ncbi:MAG: nucleotidyltransferase domain-containing protein [Gemmataceae bacterium]|nr:nucleotidyltransferase domain-containing protein [Gemmataceae bacterium]